MADLKAEPSFLVQEWLQSWKDFGVADILPIPKNLDLASEEAPTLTLVLLIPVKKENFSKEELELATKMMAAIGLSADQVGICFEDSDCLSLENYDPAITDPNAMHLSFGQTNRKFLEKNPIETYALSEVLKNSALKKSVWGTLKNIQTKLLSN